MPENKDALTEEEFAELLQSSTDEEKLEIFQILANVVKENPEIAANLTDEQLAGGDAAFKRFAEVLQVRKMVFEMKRQLERQLQLIEDRIRARIADAAETASPAFFDDNKNRREH